jgi:hypothetical protein
VSLCIRSLCATEGHRIPTRQMLALDTCSPPIPSHAFDMLMVSILTAERRPPNGGNRRTNLPSSGKRAYNPRVGRGQA